MATRKTILFIFILFNVFFCEKVDKGDDPEYENRLKETLSRYKSNIKEDYTISETSNTKEEAIKKYLEAVQRNEPDRFIFSKEEYFNIFLPNTLGMETLTSKMPEKEAWELTDIRRKAALSRIQDIFKANPGKSFTITKLTWRDDPKIMNAITGYRVGTLEIRIGNHTHTIEEIRLIVGHKGKYKVCVIGT
ncbi:hypothetical protein [Leptospira haakeii]|uniref:Penicillin-binding protein activator LpoB n=1 Tax=Leptospira haakeii TaxID=2023198 RepID=A0ABX4PLW6_9LEPT|nr:hypothetical protein [Leptospira haakeii]PKA16776.1 hypothetical protein CH363_05075 [Leptospira haakeii]PKA19333.1 hypothetical protein CH377_13525 [Leptospira haakeii]